MTKEEARVKAERTSELNGGRPFKVVEVTYVGGDKGYDVSPVDISLVGKRVRTKIEDCDTDENSNERKIPIGTEGLVNDLNHVDIDGVPSFDIFWDNGGWTIWTADELARDAEICAS